MTTFRLALALLPSLLAGDALAAACTGRDLVAELEGSDPAAHARLDAGLAAIPHAEGHFFRIEKPGTPPSHIFGTSHVSDARAVGQVARIADEVARSRVLLVELDLDELGLLDQAALIERNTLPDGKTLDDDLTAAEEKALGAMTAKHGMPWFTARKLRASFLAIATALPPCAKIADLMGEKVLDELIVEKARDEGVEVKALETLDEQLAVIAALDDGAQLKALVEASTASPTLADDMYETTLALYGAGRVALIEPLFLDVLASRYPATRAAYLDMRGPLIEKRNALMHERAKTHVAEGGAFIAVGALHLPGAGGLVSRFEKDGYRVTPLK